MSWSKTELENASNAEQDVEEQNRYMDMASCDIADILSMIAEWPSDIRKVSDIRPKSAKDVQHITTECAMRLRLLRKTWDRVDEQQAREAELNAEIEDLKDDIRDLQAEVEDLEMLLEEAQES